MASWPTIFLTALLTFFVLLVHGFHPAAEDGGIYTAGVWLRLHPGLFPHDAAFVQAPMAYSQFAWLLAAAARCSHLLPEWTIFLCHLLTVGLTLLAAKRVARNCGCDTEEQLGAVALLAAWWTLPVAGTSLNIADPYLTARSFSTPLSLFAISFALEAWTDRGRRLKWKPLLLCICSLLLTAAMHRLMFGFAAVLVVMIRAKMSPRWRWWLAAFVVCAIVGCVILRTSAKPESTAFLQAQLTRGYWYLREWRWFEIAGLVAPLLIFAGFLKTTRRGEVRDLCAVSLAAGALSVLLAATFATEDASRHIIARLQPLRMFMLLYLLMTLLLGAWVVDWSRRLAERTKSDGLAGLLRTVPLMTVCLAAVALFSNQRSEFANSRHIEAPWLHGDDINPWSKAFVWCRKNTDEDALFAIDALYIHHAGEDAQTFRATALRSVLPDQSKDGGEAAVDSELADRWRDGMEAQTNLDTLADDEKEVRLRPLGVSWLVLTAASHTRFYCPYNSSVVKVCRLPRTD